MDHLPLQAYMAMNGRTDHANRLPGVQFQKTEAFYRQAPDCRYWSDKTYRLAKELLAEVGDDVFNAVMDGIDESWLEARTWMELSQGYDRVQHALHTGTNTPDALRSAFVDGDTESETAK